HGGQPEDDGGRRADGHADEHRDDQGRQVPHLAGVRGQGGRAERRQGCEAGLPQAELPRHEDRVEGVGEDRAERDEDDRRLREHQTSRTRRAPNRPCGRSSRMTNSRPKAMRSRQLEPTYCTANTSARPSSSPPTRAPGSEPMPPTMITARPLSSIAAPMPSWALLTFIAKSAPATAPRAEEMAKVV